MSDPWEQPFRPTIEEASAVQDWHDRIEAFKAIAQQIGKANEDMIRSCDAVLGVLDGAELDSGTVSEIGFAAALGKKCYGLRTDFRDCWRIRRNAIQPAGPVLDRGQRWKAVQKD